MKISKIIKYLKDKKNTPYLLLTLVGVILATFKYGFIPTIIVFASLIILSYLLGLLVGYLFM